MAEGPDRALVEVDLNARVGGNGTYVGFEDVCGPRPLAGETVRVVEPESEVYGEAVVVRVDEKRRLIYLAVDWSALSATASGQAGRAGEPQP